MTELPVHSLETFATHDGPGIRLVVFTQGCNLRCLYCQNPDTIALKTEKMQLMSADEIIARLEKGRRYYYPHGGLTVSGGEPTLHAEALVELFDAVQAAGYHTALDTNGSIVSDAVKRLYGLTDLVIMDVKHIDTEWHKKLVGTGNETVLENVAFREEQGLPMWLRYVLVPGWTDDMEHVRRWAEAFADYKTVERVEVLPYHRLGVYKYEQLGKQYALEATKPPTEATKEAVVTLFEKYFGTVVLR